MKQEREGEREEGNRRGTLVDEDAECVTSTEVSTLDQLDAHNRENNGMEQAANS